MSSKRRLRRNACGNKIKHPTQAAARAAISSLWRKMGGAMGYLRAYRCTWCGAWHIGHTTKTFYL